MPSTYIPKNALFIYAHPDDIEFGVAGTAAVWAKHGCNVKYIIVTDGNIGSHDPDMTSERLAEIRQAESRAAAAHVGASVDFLHYPDGRVQPTLELRRDLVREIRKHQADVVVTGDPRVLFRRDTYINHPDHRAVAQAAIDACFPAPNSPLIFPEIMEEGYGPIDINYVYVSSPESGINYYVDITETIDLKIEALKMHECQMRGWDPTDRIKEWSAGTGKMVGFQYAEAYKRLTLKEPQEQENDTDES